jgi:glycerol-3-phosphate dehydrogenase
MGERIMRKLAEVDLLIIGAGVVGASLARELSRYDLQVMLAEREADVSFGASKANSGIIHSGIHDQPGSLKARLCLAGNRLFPVLAEELDLLYKNNGTLIVAQDSAELIALEELRQNGLANGVTGITVLGGAEVSKLEPNLSPGLAGGLWVPSGGIIATYDLVFALVENAVANGVHLELSTEVTGIKTVANQFMVETNRGEILTRYVVNAAGIHSGLIARLAGDESFSITPRKGEEYLLDRRLEGLITRTIFPLPGKESKGILVIPTVGGNIMIGPTAAKAESFNDRTTSAAGWTEIYQSVAGLVPSIRPADLIASFAGLRAISDRDDFIIGPAPGLPGFFNAAGIKSPGLTAAPAIAQYLAEALRDQDLPLKPRPNFNPLRRLTRLRHLSREEQAQLMAVDPAYANIICRCELVSEAEIRAAIRRGATTTDGIKLRTRAGMGRCQGGFCTPKLIQILSEELGLPPEEITKKGPGSPLLMGRLRT